MAIKDSFYVYRSYVEAINQLPKTKRWDAFMAIADYAMDGIEPDMSKLGVAGSPFFVAKPLLDKAEKNRQAAIVREANKKAKKEQERAEKEQALAEQEQDEAQPTTKVKVKGKVKVKAYVVDPLKGSTTISADREAPDGGAPAPAELVTADESEKLLEELKNKRLIEQAALAAVKGARG